ncbi:MAG: hypothetical protein IAF02_17110 [Anaerolineae bacterium]|nr:hypothetical protein [Anaerolineae bacterium]
MIRKNSFQFNSSFCGCLEDLFLFGIGFYPRFPPIVILFYDGIKLRHNGRSIKF